MKATLLLLVYVVLCLPLIISAQTLQSGIPELSKGADAIITGKVVSQKSEWNNGKRAIFTKVTLAVDEYLKGNRSQKSITIMHPGGEVDGIGELYTHVPTFNNDEEVLLFIKKRENSNDYSVFQGESGKITLYVDENGEKVSAQRTKVAFLKNEIQKSLSVR
jgi:hypothetical protein